MCKSADEKSDVLWRDGRYIRFRSATYEEQGKKAGRAIAPDRARSTFRGSPNADMVTHHNVPDSTKVADSETTDREISVCAWMMRQRAKGWSDSTIEEITPGHNQDHTLAA